VDLNFYLDKSDGEAERRGSGRQGARWRVRGGRAATGKAQVEERTWIRKVLARGIKNGYKRA
jgi:hypothetical protein